MRDKKDVRIFFALWPDPATRKQLARRARLIPLERPARRVPDYNLHMTLHFIGNVFFDEMACLQRQARQVSGKGFELVVDSHGHFRKPRVAWLGLNELPTALERLHCELGRQLQPCGYQPETRRYHPHVTVARKMNRAADIKDFEPLHWKVDNFVLVESREADNGVRYEVIESYPLT
ncbi:MAG: RNA 2',3'-cyclic phosphodiesterase [Gammaproteobacteria bacterium]|nr:MAG: RNA 2',3'-cyclic phosphodiesterase [Gammaproteobacteria bacterium]